MLKHVLGLIFSVTVPLSLGCSGGVIDGGGTGDGDGGTGGGGPIGCVGRGCNVNTNCPSNLGPTTLTGTVRIPAGTLPLYNAKVYIPSGEPPSAPTSGASCLLCDQVVPSDAVTSTVTDINGNFKLTNVPHGTDIPLVIRVGKWQRVVTIPAIQECATTPLDATMTRLPRNKSEGNIPQIALSTGGADALECLLRSKKLGLDDTEFTNDKGSGRVHLFAGGSASVNNTQGANKFAANLNGGASFTPSSPWWDQAANLSKYDIVVLSCEGDQLAATKSTNARAALQTYINAGGRVFASHWHNYWISGAPAPLNTVATFVGNGSGTNFNNPITADINITPAFTKGVALADWLQLPDVGGTTTRGKLVINNARITINTINQSLTQTWVTYNNGGTVTPQYFSFNAPVGASASAQCGQMVFTDMHVSGSATGDTSSPGTAFPGGCVTNSLSAQEKALIFMLFDLTNCLQPQVG